MANAAWCCTLRVSPTICDKWWGSGVIGKHNATWLAVEDGQPVDWEDKQWYDLTQASFRVVGLSNV
jgi:hypothetical protein